jgi:hypothetical protein
MKEDVLDKLRGESSESGYILVTDGRREKNHSVAIAIQHSDFK